MKLTGLIKFVAGSALAFSAIQASAQAESPTLKIGDRAPAISVEVWLRGQPVEKFENGKVYVLDFWATWCGGCIMSFPHISGIAEKYQDKVSFSSIDTYEDIDGSDEDPVDKVKRFLETPEAKKLTLSIAVDGSDNSMRDNWIMPLRRKGLPTTYVIDQEGKIAWIDVNLDNLDWVLGEVLAKRWDRESAAKRMERRDAIEDKLFASFRDESGDNTQLYQQMLLDVERFENDFSDRKDLVAFYKFMILMKLDRAKLPELLDQMANDPRSKYLNLSDVAGLSMRESDLSQKTYESVARVLERCLENPHPQPNTCGENSTTYERLAAAYYAAGDASNAVDAIEKSISLASEEGISDDQVKGLEESLKKYKGTVASAK